MQKQFSLTGVSLNKSKFLPVVLGKYVGMWFFLFLAMVYGTSAHATEGYEVSGYFVYTVFDDNNIPLYKEARLFNVKVRSPEWHIRTEPVEERKNGIGFWEGGSITNNDIIFLTGLAVAYAPDKSPVQPIRAAIKELKMDDIAFRVQMPNSISNRIGMNQNNATNGARKMNNVAVALHFTGNVPPANSSFIALLWFAYTKQAALKGASEGSYLLPQVWDDGKPNENQFKHAVWTTFEDAPWLIKSASYEWSGLITRSDGEEVKLDSSISPSNWAAIYQVDSTTNLNGLVLPLNFELTRFQKPRSKSNPPKVLSTVIASVVSAALISTPTPLEIALPGKTMVSDYRLAATETHGQPMKYYVTSNLSPSIDALKTTSAYKRDSMAPGANAPVGTQSGRRRVVVLVLIAMTLLGVFLLQARRVR